MVEKITLTPVDGIPPDSRVYHYDELPERAKERFPRLIKTDGRDVATPEQICNTFESDDIIKFTNYYRITVRQESPRA
ncbi:hypothetical protein SAMN05421809_2062 [Natronorubrum daqingense]|uniref:DUF7979 domain-containing protein n=1 Tax=Natronorubrum daqingense TaxID=588898 RepID=A0A1N7D4W2_9EURY|nr:hypothetical protein BB347_11635 [Natronorubrum daqingense]SIR70926.1 hypothetical protein SAMN05421809_2062 [Natronorubrum daqingense]